MAAALAPSEVYHFSKKLREFCHKEQQFGPENTMREPGL
jgi:hypothetical protein